jgi:endonuclease III-like uncharacterized protein
VSHPCVSAVVTQRTTFEYAAKALRDQAAAWRKELTDKRGLAALSASFVSDFNEQRCKDLESLAAQFDKHAQQLAAYEKQLLTALLGVPPAAPGA